MRVLNLYAGIGGNRIHWDGCEVVAVELNPEIAAYYKSKFPSDTVIVADAHDYLLKNFKDFDFIWSSPPCPTHSRANNSLKGYGLYRYPDMKLYEEIIFLSHFFKGKYVVENVIPYYKPLIAPSAKIDRHLFWSNFYISDIELKREGNVAKLTKEVLAQQRGVSMPKIKDARKALRNMVHPKIGEHILKEAIR